MLEYVVEAHDIEIAPVIGNVGRKETLDNAVQSRLSVSGSSRRLDPVDESPWLETLQLGPEGSAAAPHIEDSATIGH